MSPLLQLFISPLSHVFLRAFQKEGSRICIIFAEGQKGSRQISLAGKGTHAKATTKTIKAKKKKKALPLAKDEKKVVFGFYCLCYENTHLKALLFFLDFNSFMAFLRQ